jgi:hypothetical protein
MRCRHCHFLRSLGEKILENYHSLEIYIYWISLRFSLFPMVHWVNIDSYWSIVLAPMYLQNC